MLQGNIAVAFKHPCGNNLSIHFVREGIHVQTMEFGRGFSHCCNFWFGIPQAQNAPFGARWELQAEACTLQFQPVTLNVADQQHRAWPLRNRRIEFTAADG